MGRTVKKPMERKADIIQAARLLFLQKQYEKTTMQDIMEFLNIAKGTIYHYFSSKEELLEEVVKDIVTQNCKCLLACVHQAQGSALEKLETLTKMSNISEENKPILEHLHASGNEVLHLRLLTETIVKQAPIYALLIEQGCKEGVFTTKYPLESAEFILSGIQFMTDMGIYPWSKEDLVRRINVFPRLIEHLLQAPPNSFQFLFQFIAY